ncbi:hypothetical protein JCM11491_000241 [Sporobolomyces phaffii]
MQALHDWYYGFSQAQVPSLVGKTFIVTGGSNGIGLSISRTLYSHGARVVIVGGQRDHLDGAVDYIKTGDLKYAPKSYSSGFGSQEDNSGDGGQESGEVASHLCELKDLEAVSKLAKLLAKDEDRIDGLLLIAGLGVNAFEATRDGYDSHLVVNSISQILLLSHLLPVLEKTSKLPDADVRVCSMSSELHRATFGGPGENFGGSRFETDDEFKRDVGPANLYARSKLADILLVKRLVQLYIAPADSRVLVYATHPGGVNTGQVDQYKDAYGETVGAVLKTVLPPIMRAPDDGALSVLWAATAPEARQKYASGTYFSNPDQDGKETNEAKDQEMIENFWNRSIEIIEKCAGPDSLGPFKA